MGKSGAGVYAVTTDRGEYVLRVQSAHVDTPFEEHIALLRRVAERGIAPAIVHVDDGARAVVTKRIQGLSLAAALGDTAQRTAFLGSLVAQLRALQALDATNVPARDPVGYARRVWDEQRTRPAFPKWGREMDGLLADGARALAEDPRRVLGHNDMNPSNVLWDGTQVWLVDWDAAGTAHPFYDLAVFVMFLDLPPDAAHGLLALQQGVPPTDRERETFALLRRLSALLTGSLFLRFVPDLSRFAAPTRADAPTMAQCKADMTAGKLDLSAPSGCAAFGLALLGIAANQ